MKPWFIVPLLLSTIAYAGLPPTSVKDSTDSAPVTTFFFQFPNFTGTHTGSTFSLGVNGIAGGGTNQTSFPTNGAIYFDGTRLAGDATDFISYDGSGHTGAGGIYEPSYSFTVHGNSSIGFAVADVTIIGGASSAAVHVLNGGLQHTVRTITSNLTVDTTTTDYLILCNQSGTITITLPAPTAGRILIIKDISGTAGTNNITLARHASEQIEGLAASRTLQTNFGSWTVISDGTNWYIL